MRELSQCEESNNQETTQPLVALVLHQLAREGGTPDVAAALGCDVERGWLHARLLGRALDASWRAR